MEIVFVDTEYAGERAATTPVSVGLVTLEGESLHVALEDYDSDQGWLRQHVLSQIDEAGRVCRFEANGCRLRDHAEGPVDPPAADSGDAGRASGRHFRSGPRGA